MLLVVIALLLLCFVWFYYRRKTNLNNALISEISKRDAEVGRLLSEISLLKSKIGDYERIIDDKKNDFERFYYSGQSLYNDICNGRSIAKWKSDDEKDFINYYKLVDYDFIDEIDTTYNNLSDHYKVILILEKMIDDKTQRLEMLGMAASSYRSAKSRIEGMRK